MMRDEAGTGLQPSADADMFLPASRQPAVVAPDRFEMAPVIPDGYAPTQVTARQLKAGDLFRHSDGQVYRIEAIERDAPYHLMIKSTWVEPGHAVLYSPRGEADPATVYRPTSHPRQLAPGSGQAPPDSGA